MSQSFGFKKVRKLFLINFRRYVDFYFLTDSICTMDGRSLKVTSSDRYFFLLFVRLDLIQFTTLPLFVPRHFLFTSSSSKFQPLPLTLFRSPLLIYLSRSTSLTHNSKSESQNNTSEILPLSPTTLTSGPVPRLPISGPTCPSPP